MKEMEYRHKKQRDRVDFQVLVLTALIVIISCYLVFFLNYYFFHKNMIEELQQRAYDIHDFLDDKLDRDIFYDLNVRQDSHTGLYLVAKDMLESTRGAAGVRYLYTAKEDSNGNFIYLVDGLSADSEDFRYIGDAIEAECVKDMERALKGEQVLPQEINKTAWGSIYIAYFPMHDGERIIGVLGIEFDAGNQYEIYHNMAILTPIVIICFCIIGAVIAVGLFHRISNPSYQDLASTDFLTGLKNRNSFETDLNNLNRYKDKQRITLLSIDLNRLKVVNDTYGHAAGDDYIKTCADVIQSCITEPDVVYRIGGDEFLAVLKEKENACIQAIIAEAKNKIADIKRDREYDISFSAGFAVYDAASDVTLFDTMKRADREMYKDKRMQREQKG